MDTQDTVFTYRPKWFLIVLVLAVGGVSSYLSLPTALNYSGYIKFKSLVISGIIGQVLAWILVAFCVGMLVMGILILIMRIFTSSKLTIKHNLLTVPVAIPYPKTKTYDLSKLVGTNLRIMNGSTILDITLSDYKFAIAASCFESKEEFKRFVDLIKARLEKK